jgi:hypothetical protein
MDSPITSTEASSSPDPIQVEPEARRRTKGIIARRFSAVALAAVLLTGGGLATSQPAQAASASCGGARCTVYLSKAETWVLGYVGVPKPPAWTPPPIQAAYYASAYTHRWIARQYASWGYCSGFRLSIYPWETQGYFGYRC